MSDRILVPLDTSRFAEHAIPWARAAAPEGGALRLVAVLNVEGAGRVEGTPGSPEAADTERLEEKVRGYLNQVAEAVEALDPAIEVGTRVLRPANVVSALLREADDHRSDLVVMTTHGRGPLQRAWLGSVADGLLRRSSCPVLLVRPEEAAPAGADGSPIDRDVPKVRHILVPLDGSSRSAETLDHVMPLARRAGARITLLRVIPPIRGGAFPYVAAPVHEEEDPSEAESEARTELEAVAEPLQRAGLNVDVAVDVVNEPAAGILRSVKELDVDIIAMATRGRGGVERLVLGSVADKVVRGADTPVLVCRPSNEDTGEG